MKNLDVQKMEAATVKILVSGARNTSLPIVTIDGVNYSQKTVQEVVTGFVTALDNGNALVSGNKKVTGIRTIEGTQLPAGVIQAVNQIKVAFDTTDTVDDAGLIGSLFNDPAPALLKNAEFRLIQDGTELLKTNVDGVQNTKASESSFNDFAEFSDVIIRGGLDFNFNFKIPNGTIDSKLAYKIYYNAIQYTPVGKASDSFSARACA